MFTTDLLCGTCLCVAMAAAQNSATILRVDVDNFVAYGYDVNDVSALAKTAGPVSATPPANFSNWVSLADIVAVNGRPAKGTMLFQTQVISLSPAAAPGQAVADVTRGQHGHYAFEFVQPDGTQIGSVFAVGLSAGVPAPGSPEGSIAGNNTIVGGTGAFWGAGGTMNQSQAGSRLASQAEDPSMRRIHGGAKAQFLLQIVPAARPDILVTPAGLPGVFHADWAPVTAANPARAGETLIAYASGLGPTRPVLAPDAVFASDPLSVVTSPVEVIVAGQPSPAINQVGVPGTAGTYRIDFRVPDGVSAGMALVRLRVAWIEGAAIRIPFR